MLKNFIPLIAAVLFLWGCSADYETFGSSDYNDFESIAFENQSGDVSVYSSEHKIVITMEEPPESLSTWSSVTVTSLDMSHFAKLYLVESKFRDFPTDSASLDSLANLLAYSEDPIKVGDEIKIPKSHVVYVMVVSESGKPSLWQLSFEIAGGNSEPADDDDSKDKEEDETKSSDASLKLVFKDEVENYESGDTIYVTFAEGVDLSKVVLETEAIHEKAQVDVKPSSVKDWSGAKTFTVTAEDGTSRTWVVVAQVIKSSETDFQQIVFKNQLKFRKSGDTLYATLVSGSEISSATLDEYKISARATISPDPTSITAWKDFQSFKVVAEDKTEKVWVVALSVAAEGETASSDKELISITAEGQTEEATIDTQEKTIVLHLSSSSARSAVSVTVQVSATASHNFTSSSIDLRTPKTLTIVAEDGSSDEWTVQADYPVEVLATAPRIVSMKIAGQTAVVDSVQEDGKWVFWVHYDNLTFLADLTKLTVSGIQLTAGATITGVTDGSSYDLSYGQKVTVSNGTESVDYEIRAGYQYPNSDFEGKWSNSKPPSWDNGNQNSGLAKVIMTEQKDLSSYGKAVQMSSKTVAGFTFASGNLFIGTFNPKGVSQLGMLGYDDGNELIDFGKPFNARPRYMEIDIKYTKAENDSCDVYIFLENRTATGTCTNGNTAGSNVCRGSSDKNILVASAWYRSTSDNDTSDPDVVSVSEPNSDGLRTLRLKLKYGTPYDASPIKNVCKSNTSKACVSALSTFGLVNSKGIDNHFNSVDGTLPVTHIRAVFAASADGNHYEGSEGSQLIVDNFRLIY